MPKRVLESETVTTTTQQLEGARSKVSLMHSSFVAMVRAMPLAELRSSPADLVIVNRLMDIDHSEGLPIIEQIKRDPSLVSTHCMLSDKLPTDHQQAAVALAGQEPSFGKNYKLEVPATHEKAPAKFPV